MQSREAGRADRMFIGSPEQEPSLLRHSPPLGFFFGPPRVLSTSCFSYLSVEILIFSSYRFGRFCVCLLACFLFHFVLLQDRSSLLSPGYPKTHYVDKVDFELTKMGLPLPFWSGTKKCVPLQPTFSLDVIRQY